MRLRVVPLVLLVLSGCAFMFPFDYTEIAPGPARIGTEWTVFRFKPPMEAALPLKGVLLELPNTAKWTDINERGVLRMDGKEITLTAEAISIDGSVYPMRFVGPIIPTGYKELYVGILGPRSRQTLVLSEVRITGSEQVTFGRVLWMNATPQ
jgi:hypothetical protein